MPNKSNKHTETAHPCPQLSQPTRAHSSSTTSTQTTRTTPQTVKSSFSHATRTPGTDSRPCFSNEPASRYPALRTHPTTFFVSTHDGIIDGGGLEAYTTPTNQTTSSCWRGLVPPVDAGQHLVVGRGVRLSDGGQQGGRVVLALRIVASRGVALHGAPGQVNQRSREPRKQKKDAT